jgi:hypothetical protein
MYTVGYVEPNFLKKVEKAERGNCSVETIGTETLDLTHYVY